jgi:hypothetical protein
MTDIDNLPPADPWRMDEWNALPDRCFIQGCESPDADQRGPVFLIDGSIHKACVPQGPES